MGLSLIREFPSQRHVAANALKITVAIFAEVVTASVVTSPRSFPQSKRSIRLRVFVALLFFGLSSP